MRRRGFTLLEVLVALVVTGLVASLAFGAASAGLDVTARLERVRRDEGGALALRSVLHDALRHAEPGSGGTDTTFAMPGTSPTLGAPHDPSVALRFVTRGVRPPLGTGGRWAVELSTSRDGLTLRAAPLDEDATPLRIVAPAVAGLDVSVLESVGGPWRDRWSRPDAPPVAVRIRFLDAAGRDALPALIARTRPEGAEGVTP